MTVGRKHGHRSPPDRREALTASGLGVVSLVLPSAAAAASDVTSDGDPLSGGTLTLPATLPDGVTPTDGFTYRSFTSDGTLVVAVETTVDLLLVGGGGGGGGGFTLTPDEGRNGGGAGAVGVAYGVTLAARSYAVVVGTGGTAGISGEFAGYEGDAGGDGGETSFDRYGTAEAVAPGGEGGQVLSGGRSRPGRDEDWSVGVTPSLSPGSLGSGTSPGGGGGAGGSPSAAQGGSGFRVPSSSGEDPSSFFGSSTIDLAGGGGGAGEIGLDGGGDGAVDVDSDGSAATGVGGGGGGGAAGRDGGVGHAGVVIVRYATGE